VSEQGCRNGFKKPRFLGFVKTSKVPILGFVGFLEKKLEKSRF